MSGKQDLLATVASMSAAERAELAAALGAAPSGSTVAKLSHTLDPLPDADVGKVVAACRAGVKAATDDPGAGDDKIGAALLAAAPSVFAAAQANSIRRRKPLVHSLQAIAGYLARRAPAHVAAAAAADAGGGKGGGK